jgi:hypothetical protein
MYSALEIKMTQTTIAGFKGRKGALAKQCENLSKLK